MLGDHLLGGNEVVFLTSARLGEAIMASADDPDRVVIHYFVDEAGNPTLFDARGKILVGTEGCSSYFMLGKVDVGDPERLASELDALRARLLADPYFKGVPSMRADGRKTAVAFHAKDDVPEVRREVFSLLIRHELRFYAVVRDKQQVLAYVRQQNERDAAYRYNENELYDSLVRHLFKRRFYQADHFRIWFARRGRSDRNKALREAMEQARADFEVDIGVTSRATVEIIPSSPKFCAGLQAVDYFLWALQRFYERGEDRYLNLVWPKTVVVHDMDDTREALHGVFYNKNKPLTLESRKK
jgi:hypothetical protein